MKKIMTLIIGVSLLFPLGALFAQERQGAQLVITKTDGTEIKGELIGLKQDSTLLLESSSRIGGSIDVSEVKIIKIVKGSKTWTGVFLGILAGGPVGCIAGAKIGEGQGMGFMSFSGFAGAIMFGLIGLVVGGIAGGAIGSSIHNYSAD